ncbi:MAG: tRNA dihydrouridine synthase DusB [Bacteroidetes bacterium]|nr:MAG: tRNA dihydrouridine synthase DusB [Bacteroidota bacterium]
MMKIGSLTFQSPPIVLAPLEDITDLPFRKLCKEQGADLVYTEFISSEGLIRDAVKSTVKMTLEEAERPVGIQIFGHDIDAMRRAAQMAEASNPDLIDINFGCPVKKVVNKGAGAGMLKDIPKMVALTKAVVETVNKPVTVKTRLGWDHTDKPIVEVAERLQDVGIQALTIHGRTRSQAYRGEADWSLIGAVKNNPRMHIPIIGNGDITHGAIAQEKMERYGVDGIMIGRAAIGYPWIFAEIKHYLRTGEELPPPSLTERTDMCSRHLSEEIQRKGERRALMEMRKTYSHYFKGIAHFKPYRLRLMEAVTIAQVQHLLEEIALSNLKVIEIS